MRLITSPRRIRVSARPGFSFVELMVALTVAAAIMAIAYPKMAPIREGAAVRSAKQSLIAYLTTARQSAIRRGTSTTFRRDGDRIWVGGTTASTRVSPEIDLLEQHNVTLVTRATLDSVRFNGRGIANPRVAANRFILTRGVTVDSVCINTLGMVGKCGL